MKRELLFLIVILLNGNCIFSHQNDNSVNIDKAIQYQVESAILDTLDISESKHELHYMNKVNIEWYINDSLQDFGIKNKHIPFQSYWDASGDTIFICGYFGREYPCGFEMNIINKIPKNYLFISPRHQYIQNEKVESSRDIPTKTSKVTLSDMPNELEPKTIYGFVEFESQDFFETENNAEKVKGLPNQQNLLRGNMKIYFKANKSDSTFKYIPNFEKH